MRTMQSANIDRERLTEKIARIAGRKAFGSIEVELREFEEKGNSKWATAWLFVWEQFPNERENRYYGNLNNTKIEDVELIRQAISEWADAPVFYRPHESKIGFISQKES